MKTKISRVGKSTISIILTLLMVITCMSFAVTETIAAQINAVASGDISYWYIAGNTSPLDWTPTSEKNSITGDRGSVTIDNFTIGTEFQFKAVAVEGTNNTWCGSYGSNDGDCKMTAGTSYGLQWNGGPSLAFTPTKTSLTFTMTQTGNNLTITENDAYYLLGLDGGDDWGKTTENKFVDNTYTKTLSANTTYSFKIQDSSNKWYGGSSISISNSGEFTLPENGNNNCSITTKDAGDYTFKFDPATKKLTVAYPNSQTGYYVIGNSAMCGTTENKWDTSYTDLPLTDDNGDGTYTRDFTISDTNERQFKIGTGSSGGNDWTTAYGPENGDATLTASSNSTAVKKAEGTKNIVFTPTTAGTYTVKFTPNGDTGTVTVVYPTVTHTVTCNTPTNGTVELNKTTVAAGESYTITATPNNNYRVGSVKIDGVEQLTEPVKASTNGGVYTQTVTPTDDDDVVVEFIYCYRIKGSLAKSAGINNSSAEWTSGFATALPLSETEVSGDSTYYYLTVTLTQSDVNSEYNFFRVITPEYEYGTYGNDSDVTKNNVEMSSHNSESAGYGCIQGNTNGAFYMSSPGTYRIYVAKKGQGDNQGAPNLWVVKEATPATSYYLSYYLTSDNQNHFSTDTFTEVTSNGVTSYIYNLAQSDFANTIVPNGNKFKITTRNQESTDADNYTVTNAEGLELQVSDNLGATLSKDTYTNICLSTLPTTDIVIEYSPNGGTGGAPVIKVWTKADYDNRVTPLFSFYGLNGGFSGISVDTKYPINNLYTGNIFYYDVTVTDANSGNGQFKLYKGDTVYGPTNYTSISSSTSSTHTTLNANSNQVLDFTETGTWRVYVDQTNADAPEVWAEKPTAETVNVYAKDGTIRDNNTTTDTFADTVISAGAGVSNITDTDGTSMATAKVEKGASVTVTTTVNDTNRGTYYVRGWCVNGTYSFGLNKTVNADGKYTGTLKIPEDYAGDKIEITPVYFFVDESNAVTFVVEGFDETIQGVWGNTCAAYAYYKVGDDVKGETLGAYPGQPMLNIGGRLTIQIPKTASDGTPITGITLNNYQMDKQHADMWNVTTNYQTYDYNDFNEIVAKKTGVQQIVFTFKYRSSHDNTPPETLPSTDEGTYTNGWEYLTDYQGNKVDIFGNKLSGSALADDAAYVRIVSNGYVNNYIGEYATEWTIYRNDGTKVGTIPCSALLANSAADVNSSYQAAYTALLALKGLPAKITFESNLSKNTSDATKRCDGKWYYSTSEDYVKSDVKIQYSTDNGATWTDDTFTTDTSTGATTGCSAYFTNDAFNGKTSSGNVLYSSTDEFTFTAVPRGDYVFAGWYRLKDGAITEITTTELNSSSAMTSSDTFIVRFKKVTSGSLNITHSLDTNYQGSGTTYLTVTVKDGENELYNSGEVTALPKALGSTYISSDHPTYQITVTLRTKASGKDTVHAFALNTSTYVTEAKFFNGTTTGAGTGEATNVITFTVGDLFENSVQTVTSINYKSQINKTVYKYSVKYTYPSRLYGDQAYTVAGEFSAKGLEKYVDTAANTIKDTSFFTAIAPYEENFMSSITWNVGGAAGSFTEDTADGQTTYLYTGTVTGTESTTETVKCLFNLPYAYNSGDYSAVETDGKVAAASSDSFVLSTGMLGNYTVKTTVDGKETTSFVKAPAVIYSGETAQYFMYWEVKETATGKQLTKCYSQFYNLAAYCNVSVTPVYGEKGSSGFGSETGATIAYLGDSRNQWNNGDKGTATTYSGDRLYADFALSFSHNDYLLKNYTGGDVETGVVVQKCGNLETDSTGGVNTDNDYYQTKYGTATTGIDTFILTGTQPSSGNCVKNEIALTALSNKNSIEYYYGLPNLTNPTGDTNSTTETQIRNYVFRACAYIKVGNTVTLSDPVYFNMYTTATK